jgi:hypothetical protein
MTGRWNIHGVLRRSVFVVCLMASLGFGQSSPPDLNLAYKTASDFWNLVAQRKRFEASRFLSSDVQRSAFLAWQEPPYSEPKIKSLRFGSARDRVIIGVTMKTIGLNGATFNHDVEQEWVYRGKQWVLDLDISVNNLFSSKPATDDDKVIQQVKAGLHLKTPEIDIPKDAFGKSIESAIQYEYSGPPDLVFTFVSGPQFLTLETDDLKRMDSQGRIRFVIVGRLLLSNENLPPLKLRVQSGLSQTTLEIPVKWPGRPPYRWVFSPPVIERDYTGDLKLEVFNQSDEVWKPNVASVTANWEAMPPDRSEVQPGESIVYSFKVSAPAQPDPKRQDSISLTLNGTKLILTIAAPYPVNNQPAPATPQAPPSRQTLEPLLGNTPIAPLPNR